MLSGCSRLRFTAVTSLSESLTEAFTVKLPEMFVSAAGRTMLLFGGVVSGVDVSTDTFA